MSRRRFGSLGAAPAALLLVAAGLVVGGCAPAIRSGAAKTASTTHPRRGVVAAAEPAAADAGLSILERGGNAVDAAVATALALAVVQPYAGNLGGGGFAVIRQGDDVTTLDFRETGPAAARPDLFLGPDGKPLAPDGSLVGPRATAVPGSPAGLEELQRRRGRLAWATVVAPAISMARDGFTVTPRFERAIGEERAAIGRYPAGAALFLPGGTPLRAGTRCRLPALAATLEAYAARGAPAITSGPIAAAIERAAREGGGVLTAADLEAYRPVWREPLRFRAFGWEVASMPLPSSGGLILAETLGILERRGWDKVERGSLLRAHLLAEAWRRAFADRYPLGDPAWTHATVTDLLAPAWLDRRAASIDPAHASTSATITPWPAEAPGNASLRVRSPLAGREATREGRDGQTTHLSVADGEGGFVALTTTLNGWFGCGLFVPEAGFFLNNEMDDFTTVPDQPNLLFGLSQGDGNRVRPGARPLSSMAPTIAWRDDETIALGSPNGSRIPNAVLQVFLAIAVDGESLAAAVEAPRLHHQWRPDALRYEPGYSEPVRRGLEAMGHRVELAPWHIGEVQVVRARGGTLDAWADSRGPGGTSRLEPVN